MNTDTSKFMIDMQERTGLQLRDLEARWKQAHRLYDRAIMYNPVQYKYMKDNNIQQIKKIFDQLVTEPDKTSDEIINQMLGSELENEVASNIEQELQPEMPTESPDEMLPELPTEESDELFDMSQGESDDADMEADLMSILGEPEGGESGEEEVPSESEALEEKEKSPAETGPENAGDVNA